MLVTTWNVNSIKQRMPRILEFLQERRPDVLCLQETKTTAEAFPLMDMLLAGYTAVEHSLGQWAGVALLVRDGLRIEDVRRGLPGEPVPGEARWVEAIVEGVRIASVYVHNGRALGDPAMDDKYAFLGAMRRRVAIAVADGPLIVTGDINIAPTDVDVWDAARVHGGTHVSAEERAALDAVCRAGVTDAFRVLHPDQVQFTWWDYRAGAFAGNRGMRIDLLLTTPDIAAGATACGIDRTYRKGAKPSDHAPLSLQFDLPASDQAGSSAP